MTRKFKKCSNSLRSLIGGQLLVEVCGRDTVRFLNLCALRKLRIRHVVSIDNRYEMMISIDDFYKLHPIVRKTNIRIRIKERKGLALWGKKIHRRMAFVIGMLIAIAIWYVSSLFIWKINWNGNYRITDETMLDFLKSQEIHKGIYGRKLDLQELEKSIRKTFPEVLWTSVSIKGTTLNISLRENDMILEKEDGTQKNLGEQITSPCDGVITEMIVRSGTPHVKQGDRVKKGDLLIDTRVPIANEDGTIRELMLVSADADIVIEHEMPYAEKLMSIYNDEEVSGRTRKTYLIKVGESSYAAFSQRHFRNERKIQTDITPKCFQFFDLSFHVFQNEYVEYQPIKRKYTIAQAREELYGRFRHFSETLHEKGVQIIEKNVKIKNEEDYWLLSGMLRVREKVSISAESE